MTVRLDGDGTIRLEGACPIEDAEVLVRLRLEQPDAPLDWSACEDAHTAVIQVLLVGKPTVTGPPSGLFIRSWIEPALRGADD